MQYWIVCRQHKYFNRGVSFEKNVVQLDEVSVIKHGLKIPNDVHNYTEFCDMIQKEEREFIKVME